MERADRVRIMQRSAARALRAIAAAGQTQRRHLRPHAAALGGWRGRRQGRAKSTARVGEITPQGGTNIDAALDLGYATALRHYQVGSINRVVLLTDGAANLGDVESGRAQEKGRGASQAGHRARLLRHRLGRLQRRPARTALAQWRWPLRLHQFARGSRDGIRRATRRRAARGGVGCEGAGRVQSRAASPRIARSATRSISSRRSSSATTPSMPPRSARRNPATRFTSWK